MSAKNDKPAAAEASTADERVGYRLGLPGRRVSG